MKIQTPNCQQAFTLVEALIVVSTVVVLAMMLTGLVGLADAERKAQRINCLNNLKEIGIASRQWQGDHNDKFPVSAPPVKSEFRELVMAGNATACFQLMSNELEMPKLLYCPAEAQWNCATNFKSLSRLNLSYFIGDGTTAPAPGGILSGDDNLVQNGRPVPPGLFNLWTNNLSWSKSRHQGSGNVLIADGSVQGMRQIQFTNSTGPGTNLVAIP